ncbi:MULTISPECIES: hypothetical protein [unclassified Myroides]|uniref:hypothetical protein n=1 Tax=unclassified Myroides TaxID=2642485 RepID=UPI003D2F5CCB
MYKRVNLLIATAVLFIVSFLILLKNYLLGYIFLIIIMTSLLTYFIIKLWVIYFNHFYDTKLERVNTKTKFLDDKTQRFRVFFYAFFSPLAIVIFLLFTRVQVIHDWYEPLYTSLLFIAFLWCMLFLNFTWSQNFLNKFQTPCLDDPSISHLEMTKTKIVLTEEDNKHICPDFSAIIYMGFKKKNILGNEINQEGFKRQFLVNPIQLRMDNVSLYHLHKALKQAEVIKISLKKFVTFFINEKGEIYDYDTVKNGSAIQTPKYQQLINDISAKL